MIDEQTLWHDAADEPDETRDAWIIMQTGPDLYECIKYSGFNPDGGQTWAKCAQRMEWLRWCYLSDILPETNKTK